MTSLTSAVRGRLVLPDGIEAGVVSVSGGRLRSVTPGGVGSIAPGGVEQFDDDHVVAPALIDLRTAATNPTPERALVDVGALPGLELRNPGPMATALVAANRGEAVLVVDGDVAHTDMIAFLFDLLGPDAVCLTGSARRSLPDMLRFVVLEAGVPLHDAVRAAGATPAAVLGHPDRTGALVEGLDADLVVLDADLRIVRRMQQGRWVAPAD